MTKDEAIKVFTVKSGGKKPTSIIDLNPKYYILSANNLSYSLNKKTGELGSYNPMLDYRNFNRALQNGKYEML